MINIHHPHVAMIVISIAALLMSVISGLLNKYLVYTKDFIEKKREIERIKREYEFVKKSGDPRKIRKFEKRMQMMKKLEAELSLKSFRPFIVTLAVFWLIWTWLNSLYGVMGSFIILPFPLPIIGLTSNFFWWYLISSFAFSAVTRIFFQPTW